MGLSLGAVNFAGFEVPSVVSFGGAQSLAVYRLAGGARVVDTLGPDDSDIAWEGILSGADATDRARVLDSMRIAGQPISLSWDEFFYSIVIADLELAFCNSWWVPYRIKCLIVNDANAQALPVAISFLTAVTNDLASAAEFTDVSAAAAAVAAAGTAGAGTQLHAAASVNLLAAGHSIDASIEIADLAISTSDIATAVSAAGSLAAATAARGYVARAIANYERITF